MKNVIKIARKFMLLLLVISCSEDKQTELINKEESLNNNPNPETTITKELIAAKWDLNGNENYKTLEFNKDGNYILIEKETLSNKKNISARSDEKILFGTYKIVKKSILQLSNFGELEISKLENDNIEFIIKNNRKISTITGTKTDEIEDSQNTRLLCRTWKMSTVNGKNVQGTDLDFSIIFSKAGTYFIELLDPKNEDQGGLAKWKWKNAEEDAVCYSWEDEPVCGNSNTKSVSISELKEDKLIIIEEINNVQAQYELKPLIQ